MEWAESKGGKERNERESLPNEYLTHRDTFLYSFYLAFYCTWLFYTEFSFAPSPFLYYVSSYFTVRNSKKSELS